MARYALAATVLLAGIGLGCGGAARLTADERREADARWTAEFGERTPLEAARRFTFDARWEDESVVVAVRGRGEDATLSDSSLGAAVHGYRDGEWHRLGGVTSLPAERVLHDGEAVSVSLEVDGEASLYRASVLVAGGRRPSRTWADLPSP